MAIAFRGQKASEKPESIEAERELAKWRAFRRAAEIIVPAAKELGLTFTNTIPKLSSSGKTNRYSDTRCEFRRYCNRGTSILGGGIAYVLRLYRRYMDPTWSLSESYMADIGVGYRHHRDRTSTIPDPAMGDVGIGHRRSRSRSWAKYESNIVEVRGKRRRCARQTSPMCAANVADVRYHRSPRYEAICRQGRTNA